MDREVELVATWRCPECGGRVSAMEMDGGQVAASCTGTAGENESCGWYSLVTPGGFAQTPAVAILTSAA